MDNTLQLKIITSLQDKLSGPLKKMRGSTGESAEAMKKLREQLKELESSQKRLTLFRTVSAEARDTRRAFDEAATQSNVLDKKIQELEKSVAPVSEKFKEVQQRTDQLSAAYKKNQGDLHILNAELDVARGKNRKISDRISYLNDLIKSGSGNVVQYKLEHKTLSDQFESSQKAVSRLTDKQEQLKQSIKQSGKDLSFSRRQTIAMSVEHKRAIEPLDKLKKEFDGVQKSANALSVKIKDKETTLRSLREKLTKAGISTKNLSKEEQNLKNRVDESKRSLEAKTAQLRAATEQQKRLAAAQEKYKSAQQLASNMTMSGAAGVATGRAIMAPVKSVLDAFAPAEDAYTQLKVAMMDSSGSVSSQFNDVKKLAVELGDRLPGTTADFINMMTMLKRQGMSDQTILGGLGESAANLAVLLKLPVEYAAEFSAKMQDALQAPESEMMMITDGLQRMFYAGVDANNILEGFSKMGPALGIVGKNGHEAFQMIAPMLAMFDQTSMAGEAAGNALRKVFQRSIDTDKIEKANDALKDLKVKAKLDFTDGKGEFGGLDNMFKQLQKIEKLNSVQRGMVLKELFGDDAETLQVVNTLMGKGMAGYTEMLQKMEKQASLTDRVKAQLGTLANVSEAASGSFTNALSDIGETVAPDIKKLLDWLGGLANKAGEFTRANPELVASIVKIVAVTGALIAGFGMLTIALASVIGPFAIIRYALSLFGIKAIAGIGALAKLGGAFKAVGAAILSMGKLLLANPIILIAAVIAGAAYLIYKNWDFLKAKFGEIWIGIKAYFSEGWDAVSSMTSNAWSSVSNAFSTAVALVTGYLSGFWTDTKAYFSNGFTELTNAITQWNPVQTFQSVFSSVSGFFGGLVADFSGFGRNLIQGLVDGIKGMAGQAKEAIENVGSGVVGWFKDKLGINSPSRVFVEMGGFISEGAAVGIERHQSAAMKAAKNMAASVMLAGAMTPITATGAPLHDAGAAIRFDNRAPLANTSMSASVPATAGGDHIEIHIHAAGMNPQDIARAVSLELDRRQSLKQSRRRSAYVDYGN